MIYHLPGCHNPYASLLAPSSRPLHSSSEKLLLFLATSTGLFLPFLGSRAGFLHHFFEGLESLRSPMALLVARDEDLLTAELTRLALLE
jgi:hypothetical protein